MDLEAWRRASAADATDDGAFVAWVSARARERGPAVYRELLAALELWDRAPPALQDRALATCAAADLELRGARSWTEGGPRLATFLHTPSGLELNLIPGHPPLAPFLLGRWPVTRAQWPRRLRRLGPERPAANSIPRTEVSAREARSWLSHHGLRLPSAAEWLWALRAGAGAPDLRGAWSEATSRAQEEDFAELGMLALPGQLFPHPCELHEREQRWSAFGLVDMAGNVWEHLEGEQLAGGSYRSRPGFLGAIIDLPGDQQSPTYGLRAALSLPPLPA